MKKSKIITICASVAHYKNIIPIEKELKKLGFKVVVPKTLRVMEKTNNFDVNYYKTWYTDKGDYKIKKNLMLDHFKKIIKGDAILIANFTKNGLEGYIGGNVLMEMTIAFHYSKPIYIYNQISENLPIKEEVFGLEPIFLNKDITKII